MSQIKHLFGIPVFIAQMPNHNTIKKEFEKYVDNDDYFLNIPAWHGDVDSSFSLDKNQELPWNFFIENIRPVMDDFLKELNVQKNGIDISIYAWLNRYKEHQYQEIHHHEGSGNLISCAYMLKLPENSGNFVFYQTGNDFWHGSAIKEKSMNFPYNNRYTPQLKEGDIVLFPSTLEHYVTHNTSKEVRATISANFVLK